MMADTRTILGTALGAVAENPFLHPWRICLLGRLDSPTPYAKERFVSDDSTSRAIAKFFAKHFIARPGTFAAQLADGSYRPVRRSITASDLLEHLNGTQTLGHYLLDEDSKTKMFVLDIDLNQFGWLPGVPLPESPEQESTWRNSFTRRELRTAWRDRRDPARGFIKTQLRTLLAEFSRAAHDELEIPTLSAYSGSKGAHLYGPLGIITPGTNTVTRVRAEEAREAAGLILEFCGWRRNSPGGSFWHRSEHVCTKACTDFSCTRPDDKTVLDPGTLFSVEVYPKQERVADDNSALGNLIRLPLGINLKNPRDGAFFIDETRPFGDLVPLDPEKVLAQWI